MGYLLDAGALVAVERAQRNVTAPLYKALLARTPPRTTTAVVAQVWRDGARQARLARFLRDVRIVPLDEPADRRTGELLRAAGTSDVVDAHLAITAAPDDIVLTSDPDDLTHLLRVRGCRAIVLAV